MMRFEDPAASFYLKYQKQIQEWAELKGKTRRLDKNDPVAKFYAESKKRIAEWADLIHRVRPEWRKFFLSLEPDLQAAAKRLEGHPILVNETCDERVTLVLHH